MSVRCGTISGFLSKYVRFLSNVDVLPIKTAINNQTKHPQNILSVKGMGCHSDFSWEKVVLCPWAKLYNCL